MTLKIERLQISKIEKLDDFNNEYVYDIGIDNETPYFFANDILVHNSTYFSIEPILDKFAEANVEITKESFVDLCDSIASDINESFSGFLTESFNINGERSKLIKCGRENCIIYGLYPSKKRYATLVYDSEGMRLDKDGKPGKLKIMGMDTQRADTPKHIQDFLKDVLMLVLQGTKEDDIIDFIRRFRENVKNSQPWEFGTPKRVNNLTRYGDKFRKGLKGMIPGHVMASLNWNKLRQMNGDTYSMQIMDGQKVVVCTLKDNPLKIKSIAYPIDELRLPKWFTELPFDLSIMEHKLIDQKLGNVIGSLGWNLDASKTNSKIASLFSYE